MAVHDRVLANPYVGPVPFTTGQVLYGRSHETDALVSLLLAQPVVLLHSPSGAGKTSLIQAALVPRLRRMGFVERGVARGWRGALSNGREQGRPTNRYVLSVLHTLNEVAPPAEHLPDEELAHLTLPAYLDR